MFCILRIGVTHNGGMTFSSWCSNSHPVNGGGKLLCLFQREEVNRMITFGDFLQFLHLLIDLVEFALGVGSTKKK